MDLDRFISQATTARGIYAIRPEILEAEEIEVDEDLEVVAAA